MTVAAAVTAIGAWTVTGVTSNLGTSIPVMLHPTMLPALVLDFADERAQGANEALDLGLTMGRVVLYPHHKMAVSFPGLGMSGERQGSIVTLLDAYLAEMAGDFTLGGALLEPMQIVGVRVGLLSVGGAQVYGVDLRLRWVIKV